MEQVSAKELKNRLGRYLRLVREGKTLVITDRGRPVARLVPEKPELEVRLEAMVALGILERAKGPLPPRKPVARARKSVAEIVIQNRE